MSVKTNKKVPFVEQMQQTECGICCVSMILKYYKSYESLSNIRTLVEVGRDGLRLDQLKALFSKLNFSSKALKTSIEGLSHINLPCILHWNNNHYVVLEKVTDKYFYIVDPAIGRRRVNYKEVQEKFNGITLTPIPNPNFEPKTEKENPFKLLGPHIKNNKRLFMIIFVLSLLTYVATILLPISIQRLTDTVIQEQRISLGIVALFSGAIILNFLSTYTRGKYLIRVKAILEKELQSNVFKHLLNVPYKFFELRAKGDILYRINSLDVIKNLLADNIIKGILDVGALLFIFSYMMYKSFTLATVVLVLFLIYFSTTYFIRNYLKELNLYEIVERSKLQKIQLETINSILGIKVAASEGEIFYSWNQKLEDVLNRFRKQGYVGNIYTTFNQLSVLISPVIILFVSMSLYLNNSITIGETIAFYTMTTMFFTYSSSFFQIWNSFWMASNIIERLKDITDEPVEETGEDNKDIEITGDIELENVYFSYVSDDSQPVLSDISMRIKSGQKVAIVGESGSGKSTLAKLLIGLYQPTKGMVYYNGNPISNINKKKLRKQMAIVPQEIQLLNKSVYDNITMGNMSATFNEVEKAAEIAQLHKTIEKLPMKYHTLVSDMGSNFSGGQRQRIVLARSILNKHKIVILDEATSSLDSLNELRITNYFKSIGSTSVVIAHRLSTIRNSDIIFVMDSGKIIERGNHEELLKRGGKYFELFSSMESNDSYDKATTVR